MDKLRISAAVEGFVKGDPSRFCMPGHKGNARLSKIFGDSRKDVTELSVIDNEKAVSDAEKDCAEILGVKFLRFLTGGSTAGIFSVVYAVKDYGKKLIINRSAHKSVFNILSLLNIEPVFVAEGIKDGLPVLPNEKEIEKALSDNPDAIGVLLTYPDYYGRTFDLSAIKNVVKKKGKYLLIDGAHGGHFVFVNPKLYAGNFADVWVDGAHKTLPTLNQGAAVLTNDADLICKLNDAVNIFSTTSPSYGILASVEYGIKAYNETDFTGVIKTIEETKRKIVGYGYSVLETDDPFKIPVDFGGNGVNPLTAEKILEENKVFAEMVTDRYILFMASPFNGKKDFSRLIKGIKETVKLEKNYAFEDKNAVTERVKKYLEAINSETQTVDLKDAVGRISAVNAGVFPPCYPTVVAGEKITEDVIKTLSVINAFGLSEEGKIKVIK